LDFRNLPARFDNMIVRLNAHEAAQYYGETLDLTTAIPEEKVKRYAEHIFSESHKPVIVTRGDRGLLAFDGKSHHIVPGIQFLKPIDPVGAGDTTVAIWAACLAAGISFTQSVRLAGLSAGVTVQKLQQTGVASPEEIMAFAEDVNYVHNPELAEDLRLASYVNGSQIEVVSTLVKREQIQHAVFDHDGTISVLREGWEPVMEAMMIRSILGDQFDTVSENDYQRIMLRVRQFIDKSTGIQTIVQMQSLVEMITEFGFITDDAIQTAVDYKQMFNEALMAQINVRKARVISGELEVADFTIKGAVAILQALRDHGVKLYLASGTDEADVKAEAEILGYAPVFEHRIYGAVGDIRKYSKIDAVNDCQGFDAALAAFEHFAIRCA
jgi:beta-phosphoglucomutase-like phosphatase (HAD superfamily)